MTQRRVALVTGASGGIGGACARELARGGYIVGIHYHHNLEGAQRTLADVEALGGEGHLAQFDVTDVSSVETKMREFIKQRGRLDALVAAAGTVHNQMLGLTSLDDLDRLWNINLRGVYITAKVAAKAMLRERFGRIVFFGSVVGERGSAGQSAYALTKAGLVGLGKSLARELASRQVTVNIVAPGLIETAMLIDLTAEQRNAILQHIPLQRMGNPDDVAAVVGFLCSEKAGYITGVVVPVDGGLGI